MAALDRLLRVWHRLTLVQGTGKGIGADRGSGVGSSY